MSTSEMTIYMRIQRICKHRFEPLLLTTHDQMRFSNWRRSGFDNAMSPTKDVLADPKSFLADPKKDGCQEGF